MHLQELIFLTLTLLRVKSQMGVVLMELQMGVMGLNSLEMEKNYISLQEPTVKLILQQEQETLLSTQALLNLI